MKEYPDIINDLISKNERLKQQNNFLKELLENTRETLEKILHKFDEEVK